MRRVLVTQRIVVVGGGIGAAGAAGAAKATDSTADVRVYTEFEDVGYSPCGIPYVHGKEIPDFERLFLATKATYEATGIDIRYETEVTGVDAGQQTISVRGDGTTSYDKLIVCTGFDYAPVGVPGADLDGLYYVKNIRRAMEWDKVLDGVKAAVVVEASPLGLEMVTALCHRGIETHLIDPDAWALAAATDPDIAAPVQDSWRELGAHLHFNTTLTGFTGENSVRSVTTSDGEIRCDLAVVCTKKVANTALARAAGLKIGSANGVMVDEAMHTTTAGVWAAGDCIEVPHSVSQIPIQGLSGSHAYAQGKVAGTNAAGGQRRLGDDGGRMDDRRRVLQRDPGDGARNPPCRRSGLGHLPRPLLPRSKEDPGEAAGRAGHAAAYRGADGRLGGHQGARGLPGHGGTDPDHHQ